jgi:hypothetical protein
VKTLLPASRGYFAIGVEGISKAVNLGNLLRSAHAFGASFVFTIGADDKAFELRSDTSKASTHVPVYHWRSLKELELPKAPGRARNCAHEFGSFTGLTRERVSGEDDRLASAYSLRGNFAGSPGRGVDCPPRRSLEKDLAPEIGRGASAWWVVSGTIERWTSLHSCKDGVCKLYAKCARRNAVADQYHHN